MLMLLNIAGKAKWPKIAAVLVGAIVVAVAVSWWQSREPQYQGRSLSYWVEHLSVDLGPGEGIVIGARPTEPELMPWFQPTNRSFFGDAQANREYTDQAAARKAIRAVGTNAVPILLKKVKADDAMPRRLYREIWRKAPLLVRRYTPMPALQNYAKTGLALAEIGRPAVPFLVQALDDPSFHVRLLALKSLAQIGSRADTALPRLFGLLKGKDQAFAAEALDTVVQIGPAAVTGLIELSQGNQGAGLPIASSGSVVQGPNALAHTGLALILARSPPRIGNLEWLGNSQLESDARHHAAVALWQLHRDASGLGVLIQELRSSSDAAMCVRIITLLGDMGHAARPAIPAIVALLAKQDHLENFPVPMRSLTEIAREALVKIDPDAAEKLDGSIGP